MAQLQATKNTTAFDVSPILNLLKDPIPEVRAAAVYTLTTFKSFDSLPLILQMCYEASPLVRKEIALYFSCYVTSYIDKFTIVSYEVRNEARKIPGRNSLFVIIWKWILVLSTDPDSCVCEIAEHIIDAVHFKMIKDMRRWKILDNISKTPREPDRFQRCDNGSNCVNPPGTQNVETKYLKHVFDISIPRVESLYLDYSSEYFLESQMRVPECEDPGSLSYIARKNRKERNDKVWKEVEQQNSEIHFLNDNHQQDTIGSAMSYSLSAVSLFGTSFVTPENHKPDIKTDGFDFGIFHSFEDHFISYRRDSGYVNVHDFKNKQKYRWKCRDVNDFVLLNEEDLAILGVCSDNGLLFFKNFDSGEPQLVFSIKTHMNTLDWSQHAGILASGGNGIQIWDMDHESLVQTYQGEGVTSVSLDTFGNIFLAGYQDGNVKIFDRRLGKAVSRYTYNSSIMNVNIRGRALAAINDGTVAIFDEKRAIDVCKMFHSCQLREDTFLWYFYLFLITG
jgi:regulator-associated protein of mTOR